MNERLKKLQEIGQSVWVDSLSRDDIQNGNLQRMMEDGVLGVTSNPTIFQQAIAQSNLYDQELQELAEKTDDPKVLMPMVRPPSPTYFLQPRVEACSTETRWARSGGMMLSR